MEIKHKVGDKVIALNSSGSDDRYQKRIKGEIYTIHDVIYCSKCGVQLVNIGEKSNRTENRCSCGKVNSSFNLKWTFSSLFIPIDEQYLSIMEDTEEYEICETIKKSLIEVGKLV